jgi:hypothetical protein
MTNELQLKYTFEQAIAIALTCIPKKWHIKESLNGVYCDEAGFVVATDGIVLGVVKVEVPDDYKNKILTVAFAKKLAKGQIADSPIETINSKYVEWRRVFPNDLAGSAIWPAAFSLDVMSQVLAFGKAVASTMARKKHNYLPLKLLPTKDSEVAAHVAQLGDAVIVVMPLQGYTNPSFDPSFLD